MKASGKSIAERPANVTLDQAGAFSDGPFDRTLPCPETVGDLDDRIARLNQRVNKIQNSKVGATFTKANITIFTDEDGPVQLKLIYRKGNGA